MYTFIYISDSIIIRKLQLVITNIFHNFWVHTPLMQLSMANLNSPSSRVVKDSTPFPRWILRCINFGNGESSPSLFLDVVNLYLIKFKKRWILNEREFYSFIILFIWKWILTWTKWISLVNLHLTLFSQWWILTQLFWKIGELMVNLDLMILLKRWTEVKTWGGWVQDTLWRMH